MENIVMNHETMKRTLRRLSYEIIEKHKSLDDIVLMGIKKKGVVVANIIADMIEQIEGKKVVHVDLDITSYRDDMIVNKEDRKHNVIDIDINQKTVILVDDVLYTGRSVRAAMDAIIDLGRPKSIELLILIDRGHRQIPIRADYIGKNIPTSTSETIKVFLSDLSSGDCVVILK